MEKCNICPKNCNIDRKSSRGFCKMPERIFVAKHMLHKWEEPCISGKNGAGTIFFSGCNLKCVYCQNKAISRGVAGKEYNASELLDLIISLADEGAECIEFVTPTHYTRALIPIIKEARKSISLPFVWNSGGYESVESLRALDGLIDIYMPDIKYFSGEISKAYSNAEDYFPRAADALCEMLRQVGTPKYNDIGMLERGVIMRHLVLPGCRDDSICMLTEVSKRISPKSVILSLMSQYTPDFYDISDGGYKNLTRRLTTYEYSSVLKTAESLGFDGYFQSRESASAAYTPNFNT